MPDEEVKRTSRKNRKTARASKPMDERGTVVRDAPIANLSSQSIPELSDFKQREQLRKLSNCEWNTAE